MHYSVAIKMLAGCREGLCTAGTTVLHTQVKVIFAAVKQLKQLQRKPRKNSETRDRHNTGVLLFQPFVEICMEFIR